MKFRYFRINITSSWGTVNGIAQFQLKDAGGIQINTSAMAHTARVTLNGAPQNCSDGNSATYWQFYNTSNPNWWMVDLGGLYDIRTLTVVPFNSRNMQYFSVDASRNGVTWYAVFSSCATSGSGTTDTFDISPPFKMINYLHDSRRNRFRRKGFSQGGFFPALPLDLASTSPLSGRRSRIDVLGVSRKGKIAWKPIDAKGCLSWCAADLLEGYSDGDEVLSFVDRSGHNNHFSITAGAAPLYKNNIVNGRPALLFDGSNDYYDSPALAYVRTLIIVAYYSPATFTNNQGLLTDNGSVCFMIGANSTNDFLNNSSGLVYVDGVNTLLNVTQSWHRFACVVYNSKNCVVRMGRDRTYARYWVGYVAEVIIYNRLLTAAENAACAQYLKSKYAMA